MQAPGPNTGAIKFIPLVAGAAIGYGMTSAIQRALPEPDRAHELQEQGVDAMDSRQAAVYAMAAPFSVAAGIGLGLQRRTASSGLTTSVQVATAALLSTAAGAVINAESDRAGDYVSGIGTMAALTGAGVLLGVRDEIRAFPLRMAGLALFGMAAGAAAPIVMDEARGTYTRLRTGFEHRES